MAVVILPGAQKDLFELKRYMLARWGRAQWAQAENEIFARLELIAVNPAFGKVVPELADLGIEDYSQTLTSHHRIVYKAGADACLVYIVAGFRQDFQTLLRRRILLM